MPTTSKKSFSLSTLFLVTTIVALVVSQVAMWRKLTDARAEVKDVRRKYGHIRVEDKSLTYVARITDNEQNSDAYRLHIPPGNHYLLHITDTQFPDNGYPDDPQPTASMSMNSWREGADVVLTYGIFIEEDGPHLKVHTETEQLFDFHIKDWADSNMPNEGSDLQTNPQQEFSPNETIRFMYWCNPETKRGVMLWMEPAEKWYARRGEKVRKQ